MRCMPQCEQQVLFKGVLVSPCSVSFAMLIFALPLRLASQTGVFGVCLKVLTPLPSFRQPSHLPGGVKHPGLASTLAKVHLLLAPTASCIFTQFCALESTLDLFF